MHNGATDRIVTFGFSDDDAGTGCASCPGIAGREQRPAPRMVGQEHRKPRLLPLTGPGDNGHRVSQLGNCQTITPMRPGEALTGERAGRAVSRKNMTHFGNNSGWPLATLTTRQSVLPICPEIPIALDAPEDRASWFWSQVVIIKVGDVVGRFMI